MNDPFLILLGVVGMVCVLVIFVCIVAKLEGRK